VLNDSKVVGEIIREKREEKKLTQKDLAEQLSITYQAVSKWEKGECYPDLGQIVALSEVFGVSIDSILKVNKSEDPKKTDFEVYEVIQSDLLSIALRDVNIPYNGRIIISIFNNSSTNLRLSPKMFMLFADDKIAVKPAQSDVIRYNSNTDDDELVGTKLKHEIPDFIPPKKEAQATLHFNNPVMPSGENYTYLTFYPCITPAETNLRFVIPNIFFNGLEKPNLSSHNGPSEISKALDFYLAKGNVKSVMDLTFSKTCQTNWIDTSSETIIQTSVMGNIIRY